MSLQRILCLAEGDENRRVLGARLAGEAGIELVEGRAALDGDFDLAILDGPAVDRLRPELQARREVEQPAFLPLLLMVSRQEVDERASIIGTVVDDLVQAPFHKRVLRARVDALLRVRRLSVEQREHYRRLLNGVPIGMFRASEDGRVLEGNAALAEVLGRPSAAAARGVSLAEILVGDDGESAWAERVAGESEVLGLEAEVRRADGSTVAVGVNARKTAEGRNGVAFWEGTLEDISERKEREAERLAIEARLQETEKLHVLGQLVSGLAHEVRNPLNAILTVTEALFQETGERPEYEPFQKHIRSRVTRLSDLMNDLLQYGRPVDPAKMIRQPLVDILASALDLWGDVPEGTAARARLSVARRLEAAHVLADSARLQQVFLNLLDNAAQHSPEGGEVRLRAEAAKAGWARVRVIDRGPGVSAEARARVFDPFFTTRTKGTGLGLCIVRQILERHGGRVGLRNNEPGPGCTAEVWLPLADEDAP